MNFSRKLHSDEKLNRRSIRIKGYDYSQSGGYFVTICTKNRQTLLGRINEGKTELSPFGEIAKKEWILSSTIRREILLDEFIIMQNHVHGIIFIRNIENMPVGATGRSPLQKNSSGPQKRSLASFVAGFKSAVTIKIRKLAANPNFSLWQRNYYEHVIRNEIDLEEVREYIQTNPLKWLEDENHPANIN
jgi:REP element-mobilizing transposase RayT